MGYFYLATPYSRWADGLESAYVTAAREAARLVKAGIPVFSPIAHSHPIAVHGGIDAMSHEIWLAADRPLMDAACGLIVVRAEGWHLSIGIAAEINVFKAAGKPIMYIDPLETQ